jgi:hypothetical protein
LESGFKRVRKEAGTNSRAGDFWEWLDKIRGIGEGGPTVFRRGSDVKNVETPFVKGVKTG